MQLVEAKLQNISKIMELIGQAKILLKSNGIDQWQDGYPDNACIENDINRKIGYLCVLENTIVGYLCIDYNNEPAYNDIDGKWLSIQPYVVVHRLTLDQSIRGKGLTSQILKLVEEISQSRNIHSFKIDTDEKNETMKHILKKNNFEYCGVVNFQNSRKIAYEKLI